MPVTVTGLLPKSVPAVGDVMCTVGGVALGGPNFTWKASCDCVGWFEAFQESVAFPVRVKGAARLAPCTRRMSRPLFTV